MGIRRLKQGFQPKPYIRKNRHGERVSFEQQAEAAADYLEQRWIIESSSSFVPHPPKIGDAAGGAERVDGGAGNHDDVPDGGGPPGGTSGRGGIPRELRRPDWEPTGERNLERATGKWVRRVSTFVYTYALVNAFSLR